MELDKGSSSGVNLKAMHLKDNGLQMNPMQETERR